MSGTVGLAIDVEVTKEGMPVSTVKDAPEAAAELPTVTPLLDAWGAARAVCDRTSAA